MLSNPCIGSEDLEKLVEAAKDELWAMKRPADPKLAGMFDDMLSRETDPDRAIALQNLKNLWQSEGKNAGADFRSSPLNELPLAMKARMVKTFADLGFRRYKRALELADSLEAKQAQLVRDKNYNSASFLKERIELFRKNYCTPPVFVLMRPGMVFKGKPIGYGEPGQSIGRIVDYPLNGDATFRVISVNESDATYVCELSLETSQFGGTKFISRVDASYDFDSFRGGEVHMSWTDLYSVRFSASGDLTAKDGKYLAVLAVESYGKLMVALGYSKDYMNNFEFTPILP